MVGFDPAHLRAEQRLELAKVSGTGQRWAIGPLRDRPLQEAVAAVHADSRDPVVLGVALGAALAGIELDRYASHQRLAELYRAAGADEATAVATLDWHRERARMRGHR